MRTVIIGGSHAGITAAKTLKELAPEMEVIILEKTGTISFVASSINLYFKGKIKDLADGAIDTPGQIRELGVELLLHSAATHIDPKTKTVGYTEQTASKMSLQTLHYDYLILALGSSQFALPFKPKTLSDKVLTYKNLTESQIALKKITAASDITIIGSGYIGLELADALQTQNKQVRILERMDTILFRYYDKEMAQHVLAQIPESIQVKVNTPVLKIEGQDSKLLVQTPQETLATDLVIYAVNAQPNSQLVKKLLATEPDGTIKVNDYLQTSEENIYAVGDLISVPVSESERRYVPLVSGAIITGTIAAENIVYGNLQKFKPMQRTTMSALWGLYIGSTGFTEDQAPYYHLETVAVEKEFTDHGFNEHAGKKLWLKLVFEKHSQRLIGGQLVSEFKEENLISLISTCVGQKLTAKDIVQNEFYFNPILTRKSHYLRELALLSLIKF